MGHSLKARMQSMTIFAIGTNISKLNAPLYPAFEKILQYTTIEKIMLSSIMIPTTAK
jgi:hypothetical protein